MKYQRVYIPGGTYFFTIVTFHRINLFSAQSHVETLKSAFRQIKLRHPFKILAYGILPDHIHMIWTLPPDDSDFSTRWRLIKSHFSRNFQPEPGFDTPVSRQRKGEKTIWQRRFWEHYIRDDLDLERHIEYIHYNPVKHNLVQLPFEFRNSSFRDYVKKGMYSKDWGTANPITFDDKVGFE